ncbi:MAG: hypothetical protein FWG70_04070 [Oscillospiraceae bacterium]|nr:hypothetical protein [Oscillospiraceae bacterium]
MNVEKNKNAPSTAPVLHGNSARIDPKKPVSPLFENHVSNNYSDGRELKGRSEPRLEDDAEFSKQEVDIIQT